MSSFVTKSMYDSQAAREILQRIEAIKPMAKRHWGSMDVAQMLSHCAVANEMASGIVKRPRRLIGILIGWIFKSVLTNDKIYSPGNPTDPAFVMREPRDFDLEKKRLLALVKNFAERGPEGATRHSHPFFGKLTPEEWGKAQWKHLDHHLRQFGA